MSKQELIDSFYAAIKSGDASSLSRCIHPEFVLNWPGVAAIPWAGSYRGVDGIRQFFGRLGAHVRVVSIEPQHTVETDQITIVVLNGHWQVGEKQKDVAATAANVFTFRGDQIASYTVLNNTAAFAEALAGSPDTR